MLLRIFGVCVLTLVLPALAFAYGGHDGLNCTGCHGIHNAKGEIIFAVEPNKKAINPRTKQAFTGTTSLCLGCHETVERGGLGILAVSAAHSHPYGVTPSPKVANVPAIFLRDGKLECVGCHDPHPSNPYYMYLRVDTSKGAKMAEFCALCHASKATPKDVAAMKVFDSMDERKFTPPPAPAPEAPKKK
ncbi:MAG: cytochrome c3 family protein [Thermodesulfovibrionales bacterium]